MYVEGFVNRLQRLQTYYPLPQWTLDKYDKVGGGLRHYDHLRKACDAAKALDATWSAKSILFINTASFLYYWATWQEVRF